MTKKQTFFLKSQWIRLCRYYVIELEASVEPKHVCNTKANRNRSSISFLCVGGGCGGRSRRVEYNLYSTTKRVTSGPTVRGYLTNESSDAAVVRINQQARKRLEFRCRETSTRRRGIRRVRELVAEHQSWRPGAPPPHDPG